MAEFSQVNTDMDKISMTIANMRDRLKAAKASFATSAGTLRNLGVLYGETVTAILDAPEDNAAWSEKKASLALLIDEYTAFLEDIDSAVLSLGSLTEF